MRKPDSLLLVSFLLLLASVIAAPVEARAYAGEQGQADRSLTDAILAALTPKQAERFVAGADPAELWLEDGSTLEQFIAHQAIDTASASAYHPLPNCLVVRTQDSILGIFAAGELRQFLLRGPDTDLSAQGGNALGCGVAADATAAVLSLEVSPGNFAGWAAVSAVDDRLLRVLSFDSQERAFAMVTLPLESSTGMWKMKLRQPAHVMAHVVGYFSPLAAAELPAHSHDGAQIVSGEVDESVIDPDLTRDTELLVHTLDLNNPHAVTLEQLTPTTTKGDLLAENGGDVVRLAVGTDGQVLVADSTQPTGLRWADLAAGPSFPAPVPETGQKTCWDNAGIKIPCAGTGQDGDHRSGVAWPNPRFTDNSNGTVTDNLTGLVWLKDASCADLEGTNPSGQGSWETALSATAALHRWECGLTDRGSGGWRLPTRFELESLVDLEYVFPALSNAEGTAKWSEGDPFTGVQSSHYWSSTTVADELPDQIWCLHFAAGVHTHDFRSQSFYIWPVRGGQ